jgi:hypothetical protein
MFAKDKSGALVEVSPVVRELIEKQGITDFKKKRQIVKAASDLDLVPPSVEEQVSGSGEWKKYTKDGSKEEHLYVAIPSAILPDGTSAQGLFIRAEIAPAFLQELARLIETGSK